MSYVPLWCKTNFSFLEGASHPEELIETAHGYGLPAVAVTDRDGVYGVVRAHLKAKALGISLLIGAQVTATGGSTIILIAANGHGYKNLCSLLSAGRLRSPKGQSGVTWEEICSHAEGLIALWGGPRSALANPDAPSAFVFDLKQAFGDRLYVLAVRHRLAAERRRQRSSRYRQDMRSDPAPCLTPPTAPIP